MLRRIDRGAADFVGPDLAAKHFPARLIAR